MKKKTKQELIEELENKHTEILELNLELEKLNKYKKYEDMANELYAIQQCLMDAGFTREEAFIILTSNMGK